MFNCPHCPASFLTLRLRDDHVSQFHRGQSNSSGWYEKGALDPKSGEIKALQHSLAAAKSELQKNPPISIPLPPPPKPSMNIPNGWTMDCEGNFIYEKNLGTISNPFVSVTAIIKAKVSPNHGICTMHRYEKDLSKIAQLEDKASILEARRASLVISDDAIVDVTRELHSTRKEITNLRSNIDSIRSDELILEEYFHGEIGSQQHDEWRTKFMSQTLTEVDRVQKIFKNEADKSQ